MTREKYESLPLATLKELAKARNMKGISTMKKSDLIELMIPLKKETRKYRKTEKSSKSSFFLEKYTV